MFLQRERSVICVETFVEFFPSPFSTPLHAIFVIIVVTPRKSPGERSKSEVNWKITKEKVRTRERLSSFIWNSWNLDAAWGEKFMNRAGRWKDKIKKFLTWIFKGYLTLFLPTCFAGEKSTLSVELTSSSFHIYPEIFMQPPKTTENRTRFIDLTSKHVTPQRHFPQKKRRENFITIHVTAKHCSALGMDQKKNWELPTNVFQKDFNKKKKHATMSVNAKDFRSFL